ncbi:MAG TPA: class I SAM-dependent methyltransferase [Acidimicrobiales bacterium]|nr:class I SAM-dependent methyltransferase [Acidimicrobiales bacterium]
MGWDQLRATYDRVAGRYEDRFAEELAWKPRDRDLLTAFAGAVGDPVVDLGCGPGQIGAFLGQRGRAVIGVDLSPVMAGLAAGRLTAAAVADLRRLPLAPGSVAGVVAFYSLIHVRRPELRMTVARTAHVLRPGGRVLLAVHEGDGEVERDTFLDTPVTFVATLYHLDELTDAVTAAGLRVVSADRRAPDERESPTTRLYVEAVRDR